MKSFIVLFLITSNLTLASSFSVSESSLTSLTKSVTPSSAEIESQYLAGQLNAKELSDRFGYDLYAAYGHQATKEKSTIAFQPVFTSINQYKVGVKKYSAYGFLVDANATVDSRSGISESGSDYKDIHTTKYEIGFQFDLWKDFLGRTSKSQLDSLTSLEEKASLEKKINDKMLILTTRRLYWNLVANAEKTRINKDLLKTAEKQLRDIKKRKANSVADAGEVARFEALVHQRKGQLYVLDFQQEKLFKQLQDLFPTLNGKSLNLAKYNLKKSTNEILACTLQIQSTQVAPRKFSDYDKMIGILKSVKKNQDKINAAYDDIDLKLDLKLSQTGVSSNSSDNTNYEGDYSDSVTDIQDNDRGGLSAGVSISIPFGTNKAATVKVKERLSQLQNQSMIGKIDSNLKSTHSQTKSSVGILTKLMQVQRANAKSLSIRVKSMKKKYKQARIPEYALLQDEESLSRSNLSVVDTQLMVVNTVLDYFSVFNNYPCGFNK